jgi:hypothetical protein
MRLDALGCFSRKFFHYSLYYTRRVFHLLSLLRFARLIFIIRRFTYRVVPQVTDLPISPFSSPNSSYYLVDIDSKLAQILLGQVNLPHKLLVRLGNVVEGQNAPAQTEEERRAEADESPEWQLVIVC